MCVCVCVCVCVAYVHDVGCVCDTWQNDVTFRLQWWMARRMPLSSGPDNVRLHLRGTVAGDAGMVGGGWDREEGTRERERK